MRSQLRRGLAAATATAIATCLLAISPPAQAAGTVPETVPGAAPAPAQTQTVTADALPTVQIDGVAWKQVIVGNTVFVGGEFTTARPAGAAPGVDTVPRANLLAYDIRTGVLDTSFAPTLNGRVSDLAVTPDGTKLIAVGAFTTVNGQARNRIAVFDLPSGQLNTKVKPGLNAPASGVAATNTTVYVGGYFSSIDKSARVRVAAFNVADGAILPFAVPVDDGIVKALVVSPDGSQVVLAGTFTSVGGSNRPGYGLYRADAVTGAGLPLPVNTEVRNGGTKSGLLRLASDSTSFYGVGYNYGGGGTTEGTFRANWSDGSLVTLEDCHGDTYDVAPIGDIVYTASHKHYCANSGGMPQTNPWSFWHSTAWTKSVQGVNTSDIYKYADHPGTPRPGLLAWFPETAIGTFTGSDQAVWSVTGNSDYVVYGGEFPRVNGVGQQGLVRYTTRSNAPNKQGPRLTSDTAFAPSLKTLEPGKVRVSWPALWDRDDATLTYRVFRNNTTTLVYEGTQTNSQWDGQTMSFTDEGLTPGTSVQYLVRVLDPSGNVYNSTWTSTTPGNVDAVGGYASAVLRDGASKYWRLNESTGSAAGDLAGTDAGTKGNGVGWGVAGALLSSADKAASFSATTTGVVTSKQPVFSPDTFSQEVWFKTTSSLGGRIAGFGDKASGTSTHVDRHLFMNQGRIHFGVLDGPVQATINSPATYNNGQWHQVVATMGPAGMELYVDGKLVASRADVTGGRSYTGYWRLGSDRTWAGSQSFNGSIDEYSVYPTALSARQVDNHWVASGRATTLPPPVNAKPTAAFTSSKVNLVGSFDASGSADSDGKIAAYSWNFGDGTPAGTGQNIDHTYAAAGTYTVTLSVTDNQGAVSEPVTREITVTAPPSGLIASDEFERAVAGGWGNAEVGGPWTVTGGAARFSVVGGAGTMQVPNSNSMSADLSGVSVTSARLTGEFSVDKALEGNYVGLTGRQVGAEKYMLRARLQADGQVGLFLIRSGAQMGTSVVVPNLTVVPGAKYKISMEVKGTSPTTVSGKVWKSTDPEPAAWQITKTDSTAALQAPGQVGVFTYLPASAVGAPVALSFHSLLVVSAG